MYKGSMVELARPQQRITSGTMNILIRNKTKESRKGPESEPHPAVSSAAAKAHGQGARCTTDEHNAIRKTVKRNGSIRI